MGCLAIRGAKTSAVEREETLVDFIVKRKVVIIEKVHGTN